MIYKYIYYPLLAGCFRLLELLPGNFDDDVRLHLASVRSHSDHLPSYEALSYVWGSEEDRQKVWIETQAHVSTSIAYIHVTRNLLAALRHLRHQNRSRRLWVDAICINQMDLDERNRQVRQMASIYRNAAQVAIWLGPAAETTDGAVETLRSWAKAATYDKRTGRLRVKDDYLPEMAWITDEGPLDHRSKTFISVRALFDRPWFARLWIRQEAYLSDSRATIHCGSETLQWNQLVVGALACFERLHRNSISDLEQYQKQRILVLDSVLPRSMNLKNTLRAVRPADCSDPRDKVYGVLGMVEDVDPEVVQAVDVDYGMSIGDLYKQVAKIIIDRGQNVQILGYCFPAMANINLPTWVPDWTYDDGGYVRIQEQYADLNMLSIPRDVSDDELCLKGVKAAKVVVVEPSHLSFSSTKKECVVEFQRLHGVLSSYLQDVPRDVVVKLMARAISDDEVSEHTVYHRSQEQVHLLSLQIFTDELHRLLNWKKTKSGYADTAYESGRTVRGAFINRHQHAFAVTDQGNVALIPHSARSGDILAVLLGCPSVVALRPRDGGKHSFVGMCFIHGLNWAEALVGPVPADWRFFKSFAGGRDSDWNPTFLHQQSGRRTLLDPRIHWEKLKVEASDERHATRLSEESMIRFGYPVRRPDEQYLLEEHGVELATFRLV